MASAEAPRPYRIVDNVVGEAARIIDEKCAQIERLVEHRVQEMERRLLGTRAEAASVAKRMAGLDGIDVLEIDGHAVHPRVFEVWMEMLAENRALRAALAQATEALQRSAPALAPNE